MYKYCRKELDAKLVARVNPRRAKTLQNAVLRAKGERKKAFKLTLSRAGTVLLNKRVVVEQVFSQLKEIIRIDELPFYLKKLSHVKEHINWLILAYNVLLYRNKVYGDNLRSIKRLVA
ncbi:MAG: transposase [Firmicutes bacterium]|nr:transposase [Bacillota bacterium]